MEIGVIFRWGRVVPGKEEESIRLFGEVTQYFTEAKTRGDITFFEPFFYTTGDLQIENGFFVAKGPEEKLRKFLDEDLTMGLVLKSAIVLEHFKVELLATQERIPRLMEIFVEKAKKPVLVG
jgi:hypothetical protein